MPDSIGSVSVSVVPDATAFWVRFREQTRAGATDAGRQAGQDWRRGFDTSAQTPTVRINLDTAAASAQAQRLRAELGRMPPVNLGLSASQVASLTAATNRLQDAQARLAETRKTLDDVSKKEGVTEAELKRASNDVTRAQRDQELAALRLAAAQEGIAAATERATHAADRQAAALIADQLAIKNAADKQAASAAKDQAASAKALKKITDSAETAASPMRTLAIAAAALSPEILSIGSVGAVALGALGLGAKDALVQIKQLTPEFHALQDVAGTSLAPGIQSLIDATERAQPQLERLVGDFGSAISDELSKLADSGALTQFAGFAERELPLVKKAFEGVAGAIHGLIGLINFKESDGLLKDLALAGQLATKLEEIAHKTNEFGDQINSVIDKALGGGGGGPVAKGLDKIKNALEDPIGGFKLALGEATKLFDLLDTHEAVGGTGHLAVNLQAIADAAGTAAPSLDLVAQAGGGLSILAGLDPIFAGVAISLDGLTSSLSIFVSAAAAGLSALDALIPALGAAGSLLGLSVTGAGQTDNRNIPHPTTYFPLKTSPLKKPKKPKKPPTLPSFDPSTISGFLNTALGTSPAPLTSALNSIIASAQASNTKLSDGLISQLQGQNTRLKGLTKERDQVAAELQKVNAEISTVRGAVRGTFDVTTAGQNPFGEPVTLFDIRSELAQDVKNASRFEHALKKLAREGLNKHLIAQLAEAGPGALSQAEALLSATPKQLRTINSEYRQLGAIGTETGKVAANALYDAGKRSADGFVKGLKEKKSALNKAIRDLADGMVAELKNALGIHSPSKVMHALGVFTGQGFALGISSKYGDVTRAAGGMANAAVPSSQLAGWQRRDGGGGLRDVTVNQVIQNAVPEQPSQSAIHGVRRMAYAIGR